MPPRDLMVHVNVVDFMRAKCNDLLLEVRFFMFALINDILDMVSRTSFLTYTNYLNTFENVFD